MDARTTVPFRSIDAQIRFVTTRDGREFVRGVERARYRVHEDGALTVTATSTSVDPSVTRDIFYSLHPDYRPRECFLRIQTDGRYEGSGWFRFEDGRIVADVQNVRTGARREERAIAGRVAGFCAHPVCTDALLVAAFDHASPERSQRPDHVYASSPDPYGRVGPVLTDAPAVISWLGRTSLATPAGTLPADHYGLSPVERPHDVLQEVWVLAGTGVFLRSRALGHYRTVYELTSLEIERP